MPAEVRKRIKNSGNIHENGKYKLEVCEYIKNRLKLFVGIQDVYLRDYIERVQNTLYIQMLHILSSRGYNLWKTVNMNRNGTIRSLSYIMLK